MVALKDRFGVADPQLKILVVDDFPPMRQIMKKVLKHIGFKNVEEAEDGAQAFARLKQDNFDFLVTDWIMPKMNGLELLKSIREDTRLKDIPVLMVSSESAKEKVMLALKAGVNSYVIKPFTAEVFEKKIDQIFRETVPIK
jgi:two-component system chemotaxis response regulator CheY